MSSSKKMNFLDSTNILPYDSLVTKYDREKANGHKAFVVWFTGLSGSGKSTLAHHLQLKLHQSGYQTFILDGDNTRQGLCSDLSFSSDDRHENMRRISELCKLALDAGLIVITAFISPYKKDRNSAKERCGNDHFIEIYCDADLETCEKRDVKGLYKKARKGDIKDFTGITSAYEVPENPDLIVHTKENSVDSCIDEIIRRLNLLGFLNNVQQTSKF